MATGDKIALLNIKLLNNKNNWLTFLNVSWDDLWILQQLGSNGELDPEVNFQLWKWDQKSLKTFLGSLFNSLKNIFQTTYDIDVVNVWKKKLKMLNFYLNIRSVYKEMLCCCNECKRLINIHVSKLPNVTFAQQLLCNNTLLEH